ncbi:MAG: hypothetical protein RLY93_10955 [Sumerlaeia bacterium]
MARRLNFTERQRIHRKSVILRVRVGENGQAPVLTPQFFFGQYDFPNSARVFLEAYRQASQMRFDFGAPRGDWTPEPVELRDFRDMTGVRFRLKVTRVEDPRRGLLLGHADKLKPELTGIPNTGDREPLLAVRTEDLDHLPWRLDVTEDSEPILVLNSRLSSEGKHLLENPAVRSLIFPAAIREVFRDLFFVLWADGDRAAENEGGWESHWLQFANECRGEARGTPPPAGDDPQEICDWIEGVVEGFSQQHRLADGFAKAWEEIQR